MTARRSLYYAHNCLYTRLGWCAISYWLQRFKQHRRGKEDAVTIPTCLDPRTWKLQDVKESYRKKFSESLKQVAIETAKRVFGDHSTATSASGGVDQRRGWAGALHVDAEELGADASASPDACELQFKEEARQFADAVGRLGSAVHDDGFSPLKFWRDPTNVEKMPILARVAIRYFSIQITTVVCESSFSIAGYIMRPERSSLGEDVFKHLALLKANQRYLPLVLATSWEELDRLGIAKETHVVTVE